MTHVIVVNGPPRAGKDTLIGFMGQHLNDARIQWEEFSSIDPVKEMLTKAGFYLTKKTEADRKLLAVVGEAVEEHSQWRTQQCLEKIADFDSTYNNEGVVFLHIREPENIKRVRDALNMAGATGIKFRTVFLSSSRAENVTSNEADRRVAEMEYNRYALNDGSLDELNEKARFLLIDMGVLS